MYPETTLWAFFLFFVLVYQDLHYVPVIKKKIDRT